MLMRIILTYPLVILLSVKCGFWGVFLKIAREQTQDAANLICPDCRTAESRCVNEQNCRIQKLKEREQLIWAEITDIQKRISILRGI